MAQQDKYTDAAHLIVPGHGTVLFAPAETEAFNFDQFDAHKASTFTGWDLLGGTSRENMVAFDKDGGDPTQLGIWEQDAVYSTYEATNLSLTINAVRIYKETFELAFPGGTWDEGTKSYKIGGIGSVEKAVFVVMFDGKKRAGFYMPRVSLSIGDMPELDAENFLEAQISGQILSSSHEGATRLQVYSPREVAAASGVPGAGVGH